MIFNLNRVPSPRPVRPLRKSRSLSVARILREAYHRHTKGKMTLKAVKRFLG